MSNEDTVFFLMPDGTKVSNDPSFDQAKAREEVLSSTPNTGTAGVGVDEEEAQRLIEHPATLNSGQPGVGENAVPKDPTKDLHGVLGSPAQQIQKDDAKTAAEAGASPASTSTEDPKPVDSNEAVLALRKEKAERTQAALEAAGEEEGDPDVPYSEWTAKQLKAEVAKRNADPTRDEADQLDTTGMKKKSDIATLLDEDDASAPAEDDDDDDDSTEE